MPQGTVLGVWRVLPKVLEGRNVSWCFISGSCTCFGGGSGRDSVCAFGELRLWRGLGLGLGVTDLFCFGDDFEDLLSSCLHGEELGPFVLLPRFLLRVFFLVYDESNTPFLASIFLSLCFVSFFTLMLEGSKLNVESSRWSTSSFLRSCIKGNLFWLYT